MVQKLAVRSQKQPLKVSNKLGVRTKKQPINNQTPTRKLGVLPSKKPIVIKPIGIRQETTNPGQQAFQAANPLGVNIFDPASLGQLIGSSLATGTNPVENIGEVGGGTNPFGYVNDLIGNLTDRTTWIVLAGYIIAIFIISIALYGIVTSGQQKIINSVIGQNTGGLVNTIKGKNKK